MGYGGTKEEMQRLLDRAEELSGFEYDISSYADIVQAIHVIQDEMGITGTTAKEAGTTISGALSAAGAAWSDLVTGISNGNADISQLIDNFVTTITGDGSDTNLGVFGTLIPTVEKALNGVGELIEKLVPVAILKIPDLIKTTLPSLVTAAASIVTAIGRGILDNIGSISEYVFGLVMGIVDFVFEAAPELLDGALTIVTTLAKGLSENVGELADSAVDMILELVDVLTDPETLSDLVQSAYTILGELATGLINAIPKVTDKIPEIVDNLVDVLLNEENINKYVDTGIAIWSAMFENAPKIVSSVTVAIEKILGNLVMDIMDFDWLGVGKDIWDSILNGFGSFTKGTNGLKDYFSDLFGADGTLGIDINAYERGIFNGGANANGSSTGGRRDSGGMNVTYNITTPITDQDTLDKSAQRFWNDYAYGH